MSSKHSMILLKTADSMSGKQCTRCKTIDIRWLSGFSRHDYSQDGFSNVLRILWFLQKNEFRGPLESFFPIQFGKALSKIKSEVVISYS